MYYICHKIDYKNDIFKYILCIIYFNMSKQYYQIRVDEDTFHLITICEKLYREHHPELDKIPVSKNKMVFEISVFYLDKTKYQVNREELK